MNKDFNEILDECIDRMNSGQSPEDCLKLYPEFAHELEPHLRAASELELRSTFVPSQSAKARGRERLSRARAELEEKRRESPPWLQRLFRQPKVWAPVVAALLVAIVGFSLWTVLAPVPPAPLVYAGVLEVRVTDAPTHGVSAVNITVSNIEVHKTTGETEWLSIIEEDKNFDLLKLRGVEEVLGSKEIETGNYTQIRMDVKEVIVTIDGEPQKAKLPSGKLKLLYSFEVERDKITVLTLDFDADKSVVVTGDGKVIFKPVVKIRTTKGRTNDD